MTLDPRIAAASVQGLFSLGGSLLNYGSQKEVMQKQIDLMREQNKFSEYMTNKQNSWNSEPAQMNRLAQAGLNPALAFGDSSAGGVASASAPPSLNAPQVDFSDVGLSAAQAFSAIAAGTKDSEEAKGINIDNMTRAAMNQKQLEHIDSMLQSEETNRSLSRMQRSMIRSQRDWVNFQLRLGNSTFDSQVESRVLQNLETKARTEMIKEQGLNFNADTALKKSMTALNNIDRRFRADQLKAVIENLYSQTNLNYNEAAKVFKEAVWQEFSNQDSALKLEVYKKSLPYVMYGWQQTKELNQNSIVSSKLYNKYLGKQNKFFGFDKGTQFFDSGVRGLSAVGQFMPSFYMPLNGFFQKPMGRIGF